MQFQIKRGIPGKQKCGCLMVGLYSGQELPAAAEAIDQAAGGLLTNLVRRGDFNGKADETLMLHGVAGLAAQRLLMVGLGKREKFGDQAYRQALQTATAALGKSGATDAHNTLTELEITGRDVYWKVRQAVEVTEAALYRFDTTLSEKAPKRPLRRMTLSTGASRQKTAAEEAIVHGSAIAAGRALARDLGNLPGNICTPSYLASQARRLGRGDKRLKVSVLDRAQMEKLGMGALLSVTNGSQQPPKLIVLEYRGGRTGEKPVALVGKGITFDSGGISIKPSAAMDEMKFDMCGAASVLGTIKACTAMALPLNVVGIIPSCENLPSGTATKPGDVVTSMAGTTIEVLNTDAEGRLILCDALTYAGRFKPRTVIDIATLTGACVIALGGQASGLLANDEELAGALLAAGQNAGDRAWELPLWEEYQEQLKSNFADVANVGGREAGTITAACFLARFTEKYRWAHLDIAGTAWLQGREKGATGRPVALLAQYLLDQSRAAASS